MGAVLSEKNHTSPSTENCAVPARELIVQVDGGHIPIQALTQRSFEALSAVVYRPENIQQFERHHSQIMDRVNMK